MRSAFRQRCYMANVYGSYALLAVVVAYILRPGLLIGKGIRAVPVVEVDGRTHIGNATTDELASFIAMEKAA